MRNELYLRSMLFAGAALIAAGLTYAQDEAKQSDPKPPLSHQQKAPAKPHKVWTDDDLGTIRSRGNITVAAAQNPAMPVAAGTEPSPAVKPSASPHSAGKAALSNPKTAAEADGMIAWEQRDIDSQQEFVDRLQAELEQAPPDQRERLQKSLAERQQYLADTRQEQQGLIAQKKVLEKKHSDEGNLAASSSPQ
jgi:hypothetical protein